MILDSDGIECHIANFNIATATTSTRSWNILVTQYDCGQEDSAGPPGCLQYYTQTQNTIQKYDHMSLRVGSSENSMSCSLTCMLTNMENFMLFNMHVTQHAIWFI